jgi:hypothetical protein
MAFMDPRRIPSGRSHLDESDRRRLLQLELAVAAGRFDDAQETAEDLWLEATDAHKLLYQGLSNALTAVCARQARKLRGARQIAAETRRMLAPFPRRVLDFELDTLLESVRDFVVRGEGPILLRRQGGARGATDADGAARPPLAISHRRCLPSLRFPFPFRFRFRARLRAHTREKAATDVA